MDFSPKKIAFVLLAGSQVNFSKLVGAENQFFTLFQFFGPVPGAFLGPMVGALSVLGAQVLNIAVFGKAVSLIDALRLLPMVFAAIYFGSVKKKNWSLIVPVLAITAFVLNPVGGQVWFFALFWTIPFLMKFVFPNRLFAKSLGATFTAHAVGGAIWAWTIPMTPAAWVALIPVVIFERTLFAFGITFSYIAMNTILARVEHLLPEGTISVNPQYDLKRMIVATVN
ncbi:MAG: hypothetical protein AABW85_01545 [archaeon]